MTYEVADLLNPPAEWHHAFDLVVEIYTVQALPISLQPAATKQVGELVRAGGTLLVIAAARDDDTPDDSVEGPPWPLTRASIDAFAQNDLASFSWSDLQPERSDHLPLARGVSARLGRQAGGPATAAASVRVVTASLRRMRAT